MGAAGQTRTDGWLQSMPLVTLHLTDRCNSRCISCDYWRHGRRDVTVESVAALLPDLKTLGTHTVLISGGEPLIHPQWYEIVQLLRANGLQCWLLTSGVSLSKHVRKVVESFRSITVSLDGTDAGMYAAIRGLDAFDNVCDGVRAAVGMGGDVSLRVTIQRLNYRALPCFIDLAHDLGVREVSFLSADVSNPHAFARADGFVADMALHESDLAVFDRLVDDVAHVYATDFRAGFIAESPAKLRRLPRYFDAVCGKADYPVTRCNAPEFSAVLDAHGRLSPCFFIPGPATGRSEHDNLQSRLNSTAMRELRRTIRDGRHPACRTCVCTLWRDPPAFHLRPAATGPAA